MNKVKELLIKVLDEGETTSVKDMNWPSLGIGKWLFLENRHKKELKNLQK